MIYNQYAVNSYTQRGRYSLGLSFEALRSGEVCGRYMEGTGVIPAARMGGHDVTYHWKICTVQAGMRTKW
jgi:hypothetical protein